MFVPIPVLSFMSSPDTVSELRKPNGPIVQPPDQFFSNCGQRITGGPQTVSVDKSITKMVSDTERIKDTLIHVTAKTASVG
jgi:hypothetical protein